MDENVCRTYTNKKYKKQKIKSFYDNKLGDSGAPLAGLAKMFYEPEQFSILPYKNNYTDSGEYVYTSFFIPAYTMWFGTNNIKGYDERGVVDEDAAKAYYLEERKKKEKDASVLMKYKAEYCFTPEEALILEGENRFDKTKLVEQLSRIELHKMIEPPKKIKLTWGFNKETGTIDRDSIPSYEFSPDSKILITELPMSDENGIAFQNLYVAGIDSIDADESTSTGQSDVSNFCITIKRRQLGLKPPKYVAIYKDRPKDIRTAYDNALKLLQFYNCKALLEATRVSIKQYFQQYNKLNYLLKRPKATFPQTGKHRNNNQYGVPASEPIINHQLDLISDYVTDYSDQIDFPEMLNELIKYSYENKRKFDIVAAIGMTELAEEDMLGLTPKVKDYQNKKLQNIGYYKDEYGRITFGIIETKENQIKGNYDWIRV